MINDAMKEVMRKFWVSQKQPMSGVKRTAQNFAANLAEVIEMADFFTEFRNDHRFVMRTLIEILKRLDARDFAGARELWEELDKATGPHMEFEEQYLYPKLTQLLGEARVNELLAAHQGAAEIIYNSKRILSKEVVSDEEVGQIREWVKIFFQHAADCEGTALLAEALGEEQIDELGKQLISLRETGKPLTVYKSIS